MNKEKVMQAVYEVSDLQSICDKDTRQKAIDKVETELNSKPVMPKIFDDWYIEYGSIDDFMFQFVDAYQGNPSSGVVGELFMWIYDGDSSIYDTERLDKCINAIMAGDYEVED